MRCQLRALAKFRLLVATLRGFCSQPGIAERSTRQKMPDTYKTPCL